MTTNDSIHIPTAPNIPGLNFRGFRGEDDYPHMLAVIENSKDEDVIERTDTLEDITNNYAHLVNCDPYRDMLIAEVQGQVIGYSRVFWEHLDEGIYIYNLFGFLVPEWRRQGIDAAMLTHNEARLRQIAATHPEDEPRFFQTWGADTEKGVHALAVRQGYEAIRYTYDLVRNLSEPFPEAHLPVGLEIRN